MIKPRTLQTIRQLEEPEWFHKVGNFDEIRHPGMVTTVNSWSEAVKYCTSELWDEIDLEMMNRFREDVFALSVDRFKQWNDIVDHVKPTAYELADRKIMQTVRVHQLPPGFTGCVRSNILSILLESEYADIRPVGFFAALGYWYTIGHFPCGFDGIFPDGKLVVY